MIDVNVITNYLLSLSDPDVGDGISNLKLQKLLYYCQGFNLAINDVPLFIDEIEAWEHGPVIPKVYHQYKDHGSENIPIPQDVDLSSVSHELKEIIDDVYCTYGQFSAWRLRDMTHEEPPWGSTNKGGVISLDLMKNYFLTKIRS